jgi:flagellar biosynthesis component FlhA
VLGAISGVAAFLPGVGTAVSAITGAGALIMNWWASSKQMDEQKKARAEAKTAYNAEQAERKRRFDVTNAQNERALANQQKNAMLGFGLASEKQTADIAMDKEKMAMSKDQAQWDKYLGIMQNMSSMMSNPSQRAGYAEQYRRAA